MAVFRQTHITNVPSAILEFPNELFIEGQSHNASTLTPVMNRTLTTTSSSSYNGIYTMGSKMWFYQPAIAELRGSLQIRDFSLLDGGKGKFKYNYPLIYQENRVAIPPISSQNVSTAWQNSGYAYSVSARQSVSFYDTTTLDAVGSVYPGLDLNNTPNAALFYGETLDSLYLMYVPNSGAEAQQWQSYLSSRISVDSLSASTLWNLSSYWAGTAYQNLTLVDESVDNFYFMSVYPSGGSGEAGRYILNYQSKANGSVTSYTPAIAPTSANGPVCWASSAINTGATTRAVFVPEYFSSSGSQWNFAVTTYDTADIGINPTTTTVVPTGAAIMPGSVYPGAAPNTNSWRNSIFRCWTFASGSNTYICVAPIFQSFGDLTNAPPLSNYYIHVYKCPTDNPTSIQYVSSTYVGGPGRTLGAVPLDNNFSNIALPYQNSVQFAYWSAGTESYVLGDELGKIPQTMGVDQTGRLWITAKDNSVNVFSPTISGTVTVAFQDPNAVFNGSVIDTNLLVNSYNFAGNRIVSPVTLQIEGNSCTFADGSLTKTVNTLTSGDLLVPIKINASGYIRIVANISI